MLTRQEFLDSILYKDSESQASQSVGNFKELFADFESLLIRKSKTGAARATVLMRHKSNPNKTFTVVCSPGVTELVRSGKIGMSEIAGFPVFRGDNGGNFVGLPSAGWVEVKTIKVVDFEFEAVSHEDLIEA